MIKKALQIQILLFCLLAAGHQTLSADDSPIILVLFKGEVLLTDHQGNSKEAKVGQLIYPVQTPAIRIGRASSLYLKKADRLVEVNTPGTYQIAELLGQRKIETTDALSFLKQLVQPRSYVSGITARGDGVSGAQNSERFFEAMWERIVFEADEGSSSLLPEDYLSCAAWFHQKNKPARVAYILERLNSLQSADNDFYRQMRMESLRGIRLVEINNELQQTRDRVTAASTTLHYKALLIGINSYRNPAWQNLKNPISDVRAIKSVLINHYHFAENDITILEDASYDEIISSFNQLKQVAEQNSSLFVYYAGHGYYPQDEGEGYWIPRDAGEPESLRLFLPTSIILGKIKSIKTRHTLLIADSCFSGSLIRKSRGAETNSRFYLDLSRKKSRQIITSGGLEPVDDQGTGNHSIFAGQLIKILSRDRQEPLSASELAFALRKEVKDDWGVQTPEYGRLQVMDDENGEFFFVRRESSPQPRRVQPAVIAAPVPDIAPSSVTRKQYTYQGLPRGACLAPRAFTDLRDCNFRGKKMKDINLEGANLQGVDFKYVELEDVSLTGANLTDTDWRYSSLEGLSASDSLAMNSDWRYSQISDSDLSYSRLDNCDIRYTGLKSVNLDYADLTNCDMRYSYMNDVALKETNLTDVQSTSDQLFGDHIKGIIEGIEGAVDGIEEQNAREEEPAGPTSEDNRGDSTLFLGVTPFSVSMPESNLYPFQAGIFLGKSHLFGIEYGFINKSNESATLKSEAELVTRGVFYRMFPGSSFNLLFAVNRLTWIAESTAYIEAGSEKSYTVEDEESVVIGTFAIGNQWLLDSGITIGCDWALFSNRLGDPESSRKISDNGGKSTELARAKKELEDLGDETRKEKLFDSRDHYLSLSIGYSF